MRKILVILSTALAAHAEIAGESAYAAKNYQLAFEQAMAACEQSCESTELNLLIAKAASKIGNMHEALAAYDRVLIYDEQNVQAHFAMAQIYASKGNKQVLQTELDELYKNPNLTTQQRQQLEALERKVQDRTNEVEQSPLSAQVSVGLGYESNPKHETSKEFRIFLDGDEYIAANDKSAGAASFKASANIGYKLDISDAFATSFNAGLYHKNYFKSRSKKYPDIDLLSLGAQLSWNVNDALKISLPLGYDYLILRGHGFLHSPSFGLDFAYSLKNWALNAGYNFSHGIFEKSYNKDDNFNHHSGYLGAYGVYGKQVFSFLLSADKEKASKSLSDTSDYKSFSASLGHSYAYTDALIQRIMFGYKRTNYDKYNEIFRSKRYDNDLFAQAELSYAFTNHFSVSFLAGLSLTDSNQDANDSKNFNTQINCRYLF